MEVEFNLANAVQMAAATAAADRHPHQVYFIGLDDIAAGKELGAATSIGWRYILSLSEGDSHSVEVHYDAASNQHSFGEISKGPIPNATIDLLGSEEALSQIGEGDFVFSMIRIPALYVLAAWFKDEGQNTHILIPLAPVYHPLEAGKAYTPEQFFSLLKPEAQSLLEFHINEPDSDGRP